MSFLPQTLDIDEKILDRNLRIVDAGDDLFGGEALHSQPQLNAGSLLPEPDLPSIQATPEPGLCVKTKNLSDKKFFINLCKIMQIPPPPPMTEKQLKNLIANDDYDHDFRVPMSLGSPRLEKDKAGNECLCSDVALNSAWFEDVMENSIVFVTFVVNVAMEGLCEKYGDQANVDRQNWTILKNKKYMGELQKHHIQQRAKGSKIVELDEAAINSETGAKPKSVLIKELSSSSSPSQISQVKPSKPKANSLKSNQGSGLNNSSILLKKACINGSDMVVADLSLPGVTSQKELSLDLGEDRVVVEARKANHLFDFFLPLNIEQSQASAQFNQVNQSLRIYMPIKT